MCNCLSRRCSCRRITMQAFLAIPRCGARPNPYSKRSRTRGPILSRYRAAIASRYVSTPTSIASIPSAADGEARNDAYGNEPPIRNDPVASLIGRLGGAALRLSTAAVSMSPTGSCFSSKSAPRPFPIMGFEDEVEQPIGRPCRQTNGRSKRPNELTSSIVPRGTSFHRSVELEFPSIAFDLVRPSCRCGLPGPPELGAVKFICGA